MGNCVSNTKQQKLSGQERKKLGILDTNKRNTLDPQKSKKTVKEEITPSQTPRKMSLSIRKDVQVSPSPHIEVEPE